MSSPDNKVRVFISSTFRDMHAERDHLVTAVFPELRERCERLGLEFFDVDLRWGVPEKTVDGETANSWEYCRQWIDRVEPFFICILGQRYGWVPPPEKLKNAAEAGRQTDDPRSITDMEVRYAVLETPERKRLSYFYFREAAAPETATDFVDPEQAERDRLAQLKARVRQCGRPVRDYPCEWAGDHFTGMEAFGKMVLEDLWSGILRDPRYVSKAVWHQVLGTDLDGDERYTDESQPVPEDIAEKLIPLAKPPPKNPLEAERDEMQRFADSRLRWFQGREKELGELRQFITDTADPPDASRLAVIAAVPGQGKSALMAKLSQSLTSPSLPVSPSPNLLAISHFVGATSHSSSSYHLVRRLNDELDASGITFSERPVPEGKPKEDRKLDFQSLCQRLWDRLGDYAGEKRIVILLDALNQLDDGHELGWLPYRLGPSVRVVVSCIEEAPPLGVPASAGQISPDRVNAELRTELTPAQKVLSTLESRHPKPKRIPLGPCSADDVRSIVTSYLAEYCKELDTPHVDAICDEKKLPQARNPLYLLVMLAELRPLGGNDMNQLVPALIADMGTQHPDTASLFHWVLERMEQAEGFGEQAVRWWCLYLALGRVGMSSRELSDLLIRKLGPESAATAQRIERALRRYLQRRGEQWDFFHGQLRQAVMERCGGEASRPQGHREIADYFVACAKGPDSRTEWDTDSVRGFAECVFHLAKAGMSDVAWGLLTSFVFVIQKIRVGLLEGVFDDYQIVSREVSGTVPHDFGIWKAFFREQSHLLRRGVADQSVHKILLQLALEHADDSPVTTAAETWLSDERCDWLRLQRVPRLEHLTPNPSLSVLEGHTGPVMGALLMLDGRILAWSEGEATLRLWNSVTGACDLLRGHHGPVKGALPLPDGTILSWSWDGTLRVWESATGTCLAILEGHAASVWGALSLPHGTVLSWSLDKTLRLWDAVTGTCRAIMVGHTDWIEGTLQLPGGQLLSWGDTTLRLWDIGTLSCRAVLEGHSGAVDGALSLPVGQILSWSTDKTLRLWDTVAAVCRNVFEGHTDFIRGALELSDGRILSWSDDKTLRVWDARSGTCSSVLEGHADSVWGALSLSDSRLLSWSRDGTLRLWDTVSGVCNAVLKGHTQFVNGALLLPEGLILSWSADKTLRLWDTVTGGCSMVLEGHTAVVMGAQPLPSDRILSCAGDKTLRVWDIATRVRRAVLAGHTDLVWGALPLKGGKILSRSDDKTLRIWDAATGACCAILVGHSGAVKGAMSLPRGCIISWSSDGVLRVWDGATKACRYVLKEHTGAVKGAMPLTDRRIISWSFDKTLRVWDIDTGACCVVLKGHTDLVWGALLLQDGVVLSWSDDRTLRMWDSTTGTCCAVLEGHAGPVRGALTLPDGCILSWSLDLTLRVWDATTNLCHIVMEGHTDWVQNASALPDGRILSWSHWDNTLRLWNATTGTCLEVVPERDLQARHPDWFYRKLSTEQPDGVIEDWGGIATGRTARLFHRVGFTPLPDWQAESGCNAPILLPDGTLVVTQANGQVCILKLHHGNRRVTLAEAEEILLTVRK